MHDRYFHFPGLFRPASLWQEEEENEKMDGEEKGEEKGLAHPAVVRIDKKSSTALDTNARSSLPSRAASIKYRSAAEQF